MSEARTLHVVERSADEPEGEEVFVVEFELREVPASEFEDVFRRVSEAGVEADADLPLYGVVRIHLAFLFAQNEHPPMAVTHLVVLYRLLSRRLADGEYGTIRCGDLGPDYRAVVTDVAASHGVTVQNAGRFGFHRAALGFLVGLYGYLRLVAAQFVSLAWKRLHDGPEPTKTAFVPHVNRFDSTRPVLERLDHDHEVVLPTPTASWLRHRNGRYAELVPFDPTPLDYFATVSTVVDSLVRAARLTSEVVIRRTFGERVETFFADEFGVELPNTLSYLLGNLYAVHVPSLANTVLAERMLAELQPENLVVGSLGSRQQAILYAAIRAGVRTYHVPHSATTGYELAPPPETVHFVPGEHVVEHLRESDQMADVDNVVPTGRPQLVELHGRDVAPRDDSPADAMRVVVATQPFSDPMRERFVADVLDALESTPVPVDVVIKIHPNESASFYDGDVSDRPYPVTIAERDLHGYLSGADLVVTINSNVGLESMVLGTPVVCVNEWSPLIRARPYATYGPVPVLETAEDLRAFFSDLDRERLDEVATAEQRFLDEYYFHDEAAEEIARIVREGSHRPGPHDVQTEPKADGQSSVHE